MSKINLSFDASDFEIVVSETGWANFNLAPIVATAIVEIAKAKGYHIPEKGLKWSARAKDYRGLGVGFMVEKKPQAEPAKAAKPVSGGAAQSALEEKLAKLESALAMLLAQTAGTSHAPDAKPAPVGTTITRKKKAA
jgi:hypothetical protein